MIYVGRDPAASRSGWTLHSFADGWVAATKDGDPHGPLIFHAHTVRAEAREVTELTASYRRFQTDPERERETVGQFWDRWALLVGGAIWPRDLPLPKGTSHAR